MNMKWLCEQKVEALECKLKVLRGAMTGKVWSWLISAESVCRQYLGILLLVMSRGPKTVRDVAPKAVTGGVASLNIECVVNKNVSVSSAG